MYENIDPVVSVCIKLMQLIIQHKACVRQRPSMERKPFFGMAENRWLTQIRIIQYYLFIIEMKGYRYRVYPDRQTNNGQYGR